MAPCPSPLRTAAPGTSAIAVRAFLLVIYIDLLYAQLVQRVRLFPPKCAKLHVFSFSSVEFAITG